jgi:hypothetical protein
MRRILVEGSGTRNKSHTGYLWGYNQKTSTSLRHITSHGRDASRAHDCPESFFSSLLLAL